MRTILVVSLMSCSPQALPPELGGWHGEHPLASAPVLALGQHPPPSPEVTLSASAAVPGGALELTLVGASPGERVFFARGMAGRELGAGPCPPVLGGLCVDLPAPVFLLAAVDANAQGVATFVATLPAAVPVGVEVTFQAVVPRGANSIASAPMRRVTADAVHGANQLQAGDVVITEILRDPVQTSDALGEWFELHNTTGWTVDLQGLVIADDDSDSFTLDAHLVIEPGGYAVLGEEPDPSVNGGVWLDAMWTSTTLANTADELVLIGPSGEFDRVAWSSPDWPGGGGVAMALSADALDASLNDDPLHWCDAVDPFGAGDLGTPGAANADCAALPPDPPDDSDDDGDGLSADEEAAIGTDPDVADSDGGGVDDGVEFEEGSDPLEAADDDLDQDGVGYDADCDDLVARCNVACTDRDATGTRDCDEGHGDLVLLYTGDGGGGFDWSSSDVVGHIQAAGNTVFQTGSWPTGAIADTYGVLILPSPDSDPLSSVLHDQAVALVHRGGRVVWVNEWSGYGNPGGANGLLADIGATHRFLTSSDGGVSGPITNHASPVTDGVGSLYVFYTSELSPGEGTPILMEGGNTYIVHERVGACEVVSHGDQSAWGYADTSEDNEIFIANCGTPPP